MEFRNNRELYEPDFRSVVARHNPDNEIDRIRLEDIRTDHPLSRLSDYSISPSVTDELENSMALMQHRMLEVEQRMADMELRNNPWFRQARTEEQEYRYITNYLFRENARSEDGVRAVGDDFLNERMNPFNDFIAKRVAVDSKKKKAEDFKKTSAPPKLPEV